MKGSGFRVQGAEKAEESREIIQDNYSFHMRIVGGLGNEKLVKYYQGLFNSHQRYYAIGLSERPGWPDQPETSTG